MTMEHDLLTVSEAAAHLRIATKTIYRWLDSGKLHYILIGPRSIRISASDLERYLEQKKH